MLNLPRLFTKQYFEFLEKKPPQTKKKKLTKVITTVFPLALFSG